MNLWLATQSEAGGQDALQARSLGAVAHGHPLGVHRACFFWAPEVSVGFLARARRRPEHYGHAIAHAGLEFERHGTSPVFIGFRMDSGAASSEASASAVR